MILSLLSTDSQFDPSVLASLVTSNLDIHSDTTSSAINDLTITFPLSTNKERGERDANINKDIQPPFLPAMRNQQLINYMLYL